MSAQFFEYFQVPAAAREVIGGIVTAPEILLVEAVAAPSGPPPRFTAAEARAALRAATGDGWTVAEADALLRSAYQRGVLELEDETYQCFRVGSFYTRLDIFAITESQAFLGLPPETRAALDAWYFTTYLNRLAPDAAAPTADKVVPLAEAIAYLDSFPGAIWLNRCDCRILAGHCDRPTDVCLSFRSGINTFSHRGWSTPLTRSQARTVLERADRAGLMHTVNPGGICNCCGDCCYLFRAQRARNSNPAWPAAPLLAAFRPESCVGCGGCISRCPFGAFTRRGEGIAYHSGHCRGCGLCGATCPTGAIEIVKRGNDDGDGS